MIIKNLFRFVKVVRLNLPLVMASLILLTVSCNSQNDADLYDLLIKNAKIIDGTGSESFAGHVVVDEGVIVNVGEFDAEIVQSKKTINAEGRVLSPGFIDAHSHGDPLETPRFHNFLAMGVTSVSLGQDGRSPGGRDVAAWMDKVDSAGTGPNIAHFVGHSTLRELVNAPRESGLDHGYIEQMQEILGRSLEAGSFGLTTGLEYDHGMFADSDELAALAAPVAEADGLVMSHMRSEDDDKILDSVTELLNQGRESGAHVHVSHIKIVFGDDPALAGEVLDLMDEARKEGLRLTADVYPYVASFTGIGIVFPEWALPPNDFDEVVENRREELEEYLRNRVAMRNGPEATLFGTDQWAGKTLAEVAEEKGKPFEQVLIDDIGPRGASAAYFVMDEDVMQRFLADPHVMVSSDGSPTMRHPRGYGSFARIIRKYVNEKELLTLEEAIHKMSGLTAETIGLSDPGRVETPRGIIREGYAADLLLFDPGQVSDLATFEEPHTYAKGFDRVFVNGEAVVENGNKNTELPGRVLRRR